MQISSVEYSRLVNLGNYENERVAASALVQNGDDPDATLEQLKRWVAERVADVEAEREARRQQEHLSYQISDYEIRLEQAKAKWVKAEAFLKSHGVGTEDLGDLPF